MFRALMALLHVCPATDFRSGSEVAPMKDPEPKPRAFGVVYLLLSRSYVGVAVAAFFGLPLFLRGLSRDSSIGADSMNRVSVEE